MTTDQNNRHRLTDVAAALSIAVLAGFLALFSWRVGRAGRLASPPTPSLAQDGLVPGAFLASLQGFDLAGKPVSISLSAGNRPTVIYIFSPSCGACARNLDNLKAIMATGAREYHFVGVSASDLGLRGYLNDNGLKFEAVIRDLPSTEIARLHLRVTPTTIVVSPQGKVQNEWVGAFGPRTADAVGGFFHLRLPGLLPPSVIN